MKRHSSPTPRIATALLFGLAALASSFNAQAYKYQVSSVTQGGFTSFMATDGMWDNGTPDDAGEFLLRTTLSLDDPTFQDSTVTKFYGGSVKVELTQNGKTYSSTRSLDWVSLTYDPWPSGNHGSLSLDLRTQASESTYFKFFDITSYIQVDNAGQAFANFLKPGFSVSVTEDPHNSNALLDGVVYDDLGVTGRFGTTPRSITWTTVSAVPEPATYAMLLAGLAIAGAQTMRRRRSA